jgi:hypothetical protein
MQRLDARSQPAQARILTLSSATGRQSFTRMLDTLVHANDELSRALSDAGG